MTLGTLLATSLGDSDGPKLVSFFETSLVTINKLILGKLTLLRTSLVTKMESD